MIDNTLLPGMGIGMRFWLTGLNKCSTDNIEGSGKDYLVYVMSQGAKWLVEMS